MSRKKRKRVEDFDDDYYQGYRKRQKVDHYYRPKKTNPEAEYVPVNVTQRNQYGTLLPQRRYYQSKAPRNEKDGHYVYTIGETILKRYTVYEFLGDGTFSKVLKCWDQNEGFFVALKIIRAIPKYTEAAKSEIRILKSINDKCPEPHYCIHILDSFMYNGHMCIVFPYMGLSIFDFIKLNEYRGFPLPHVRSILRQLFIAVQSFRRIGVIHTDLKPENILLKDSSYRIENGVKILYTTDIRLTDFGSALFETDHHSNTVSTRHYRSPEVILEIGWDNRTDLWSLGCIIFELFTGEALFQTHEDSEHLAIIEHYLGKIPTWLVKEVRRESILKMFNSRFKLDWPRIASGNSSRRYVKKLSTLRKALFKHKDDFHEGEKVDEEIEQLMDLMLGFLKFDRRKRLTLQQALNHKFFRMGNTR